MRYVIDHDYHIHSQLSLCSDDPRENPQAILEYAQKNGLKDICLTDHYWDEKVPGMENFDFYSIQNYAHIAQALPLPQAEGVRFRFGCETELDKDCTLGVGPDMFDKFEFIIIPTTHLHMNGFTISPENFSLERRAALYVERLEKVLAMDLPAKKVGIAHLTCSLMAPEKPEDHLTVLDSIGDDAYRRVFTELARKGFGYELNFTPGEYNAQELERVLRPYRIAKDCGCKFYFGSDAHDPERLAEAPAIFDQIIDLLGLEESDKFRPFD